MLHTRTYTPVDGELLYHYCAPETFLALCSFKTIRLSDLYAMNDFMELNWGYHIWEQAAGETLYAVGRDFLDEIDAIIHRSGLKFLTLASSLSRNGDILSQWRAYGADGRGYAVGFDPKLLVQLPIRPLKVEYDLGAQIKEVKSYILALHQVESEESAPRGEDFVNACLRLACDLASFKNPAFVEENEVRLVHLVNFKESNQSLKLVDAGGTSFGTDAPPQEVKFRMSGSTPVAYLDMDFTNGGMVQPIVQVVLGPKNDAMPSGVSVFLETLGHPSVKVRKSRASYR
jgi:hypothetical protein